MKILLLTLLTLPQLPLLAQDEPAPPPQPSEKKTAPPENPTVKKINENEYQIGKVRIHKTKRTITFPAIVNMNEGLLEFGIVHINGKIHEALLYTETRPININIALKLLSIPASDELFGILDEEYRFTGKYPDTPQDIREKARLDINLIWEQDGKTHTVPLNQLIKHNVLKKNMLPGPWLYTGSYLYEKKYKAEISGDIVAIYTAKPAIINYPGKDRNNDDVWIANTEKIPPVSTKLTVSISPHIAKPSTQKNTKNPKK